MDSKTLVTLLFSECWDGGRFDRLNEISAPEHLLHFSDGDIVGVRAYREFLEPYYKAMSPTFVIKHVIAEGDFAALHCTETGRLLQDWVTPEATYKANGLSYSTFGVEMVSTQNGRIIESWPGHDGLAQHLQLGLAEWNPGTAEQMGSV